MSFLPSFLWVSYCLEIGISQQRVVLRKERGSRLVDEAPLRHFFSLYVFFWLVFCKETEQKRLVPHHLISAVACL